MPAEKRFPRTRLLAISSRFSISKRGLLRLKRRCSAPSRKALCLRGAFIIKVDYYRSRRMLRSLHRWTDDHRTEHRTFSSERESFFPYFFFFFHFYVFFPIASTLFLPLRAFYSLSNLVLSITWPCLWWFSIFFFISSRLTSLPSTVMRSREEQKTVFVGREKKREKESMHREQSQKRETRCAYVYRCNACVCFRREEILQVFLTSVRKSHRNRFAFIKNGR